MGWPSIFSHLAWGAPGLIQVRIGVSPLTVPKSLEQSTSLQGTEPWVDLRCWAGCLHPQLPSLLLDAVGHGLAALRGYLDFAGLGATYPELELWAFWGVACVPASVIILGGVCVCGYRLDTAV